MTTNCEGFPECSVACSCNDQQECGDEDTLCEICGDDRLPGEAICLACLVASCREYGCGAFIGTVTDGQAVVS